MRKNELDAGNAVEAVYYFPSAGKQTEEELKYVKERLRIGDGGLRYIHISMQNTSDIEELSDSELQVIRSRMYDHAMEILEDDGSHLFKRITRL